MSVIAERSDGTTCLVPVDDVGDVAGLLWTVHGALGLEEKAWYRYEAAVCGGDGGETALSWFSKTALEEVGIHGCEERVCVRAKAKYVAEAALVERGLKTVPERKAAVKQWAGENSEAAAEGLRLVVVAAMELLVRPFLRAARLGQVARIKRLLAAGVPVDVGLGGKHSWPLASAADARTAALLLAHGAQVNAVDDTGRTALLAAATKGNMEVMQVLLSHGADPHLGDGHTVPLAAVVEGGYLSCLHTLVEHGLDLTTADAFIVYLAAAPRPILEDHARAIMMLLLEHVGVNSKDADHCSALYWAIQKRQHAAVITLLEYGADVGMRQTAADRSLLMCAVEEEWVEGVRLLLEHGANVNDVDAHGGTALAVAVEHKHARGGFMEIAMILLEHKANPNIAGDAGKTMLMHASARKNAPLVEQLLACGAEVNAADASGQTALMTAAHAKVVHANVVAVAKLLLDHNADPNAVDAEGRTALMRASRASRGGRPLARLLLARGGRVDAADGDGMSALHHTLFGGDPDTLTLTLLLENGADPNNRTTETGTTVLMNAAAYNEDAMLRLLAHGADVNAQDRMGRTVVAQLAGMGRLGTLRLLLGWCAAGDDQVMTDDEDCA